MTVQEQKKPGFSWRISAATLAGVIWALFQIYTGLFGELSSIPQRALHLAFALLLVFLVHPLGGGWGKWSKFATVLDLLLIAGGLTSTIYLAAEHVAVAERLGIVLPLELFLGFLTILVVLEGTRRVIGWPLPLIALFFVFYAVWGNILPGIMGHRAYSLERVIGQIFLMTEGIFGVVLGVSAGFLFLFVVFSTFLKETGGGQLFNDLAAGLAGRAMGGPAKIEIISSAFFGSISGSAIANVVSTGSFTIPLMIRSGYPRVFAAAVEAVSSTGGVLMPPLMGATAFIMAEILGVSYWDVVKAAFVPALLYYISLFAMIHFRAHKIGLKGLTKEELPNLRQVLSARGHLLIPLVGLMVMLSWKPQAINSIAVFSIFLITLMSALKPETRLSIKKIYQTLAEGSAQALPVALTCACVGIIVGMVMLTGLGVKLAGLFVTLSGGSLVLLLIGAAISSLFLGMGLPITPAYLIIILTIGPALANLGLEPMAVHLFVLYFGAISFITPPVALAAYAAAAIAKASPFHTGFTATRLGVAGFLVPFAFVANPGLILEGSLLSITIAVTKGLIGVIILAAGLEGYLTRHLTKFERFLLVAAGPLLVLPGHITDSAGLILLSIWVIFLLTNSFQKKRIKTPQL